MSAKRSRKKQQRSFTRPFNPWEKLSPRHQHLICLLILLILPVFQYSDVIIGDQKFFSPDIVQWRASAESVIEHREEYGEEPLWSSNMFSGMPAYIVSYQRSVPHIDQIFTWLAPIFPAAALWVMLSGAYLFLVRLKLHPLAALTGALLIGFTTYLPIIVGAGHNAKVYALAFIPWMFYGYLMLTRSSRTLLGLGIFALAATLEFRAGHPQVTYFFLYLFTFWWIYDTWNAHRNNELPAWLKKTGLIAAAGLLALSANIQPYWSIYEYSPHSTRGGDQVEERSGLELDYAMAWSHGWLEMTTLMVPGIQGGTSADGLYWGPKTMTSGPHYLGAMVFFLVLLTLFNVKNGLKWVFLSAALLSMLFALGEHLLWFNELFFNYMPLYDKFRAPEKWLMLTSFSFNVLAAMGVSWLFTREKDPNPTSVRLLDKPAGITIAVGLLMLIAVNTTLSYEKAGERQQIAQQVAQQNQVSPDDPRVMDFVSGYLAEIQEDRQELAQRDTLRFLLLSGLAIILAGLFLAAKIPASAAVLGIFLITAIDLVSVGNRYIPDNSKINATVAQRDFLEQRRTSYHTFIQREMRDAPYPYRVFPIDQNAFNNAVPAYFYPSVGGYTGAKMSRYQNAIDHAFSAGPARINFGLLDMLNVRYMTARQAYPFPGYEAVHESEQGIVLENRNVLPKVFFPEEVTSVSHPADALEFISDTGFDPAFRSVIEKPEDQIRDHRSDFGASFEMLTYNAREIRFRVQKQEPGYVAISEMYYPAGWTAQINGEEADIHAMNFLLRGIHLDAGEHEVSLTFSPASHTVGSALSWVFNLLILGIIGWGLVRLRTEAQGEKAADV